MIPLQEREEEEGEDSSLYYQMILSIETYFLVYVSACFYNIVASNTLKMVNGS